MGLPYRIAFFDVDHTLVDTGSGKIFESGVEAIRKLEEAGVIVCIATGRPKIHLSRIRSAVPHEYLVTCNGACVLDGAGEVLYETPLFPEDFRSLCDLAEQKNLSVAFHFSDHTYVYYRYDVFSAYYDRFVFEGHAVLKDCPERDRHLQKRYPMPHDAVVLENDEDVIPDFVAAHENLRLDRIRNHFYDVFRAGVSKASGIEKILQREHLTWKDAIVFGDSTNDVEMLEKAGLGVAMGNGHEAAKAAADVVCRDIQEDGVAHMLREVFQ